MATRFRRGGASKHLPILAAVLIVVVAGVSTALRLEVSDSGGRLARAIEANVLVVLGLGLFLGLKHATDADHVVAMTAIVSEEPGLLRSCWIGVFWGIGHTLALAIAGLTVVGFRMTIPQWVASRLELAVAAMIVSLGARLILRCLRSKVVLHRHDHAHVVGGGIPHSHWHLHPEPDSRGEHTHRGWARFGWRPIIVGMVHGLAGSAALTLLVLSTIQAPLEAFLYILVFGLGSILGMLGISFLLALPLRWARQHLAASHRSVQLLAGVFSCVFGLCLGYGIWSSGG